MTAEKMPVLLQVYSVREDAKEDFFGTLCKIREIGYAGVELAGFYGRSAKEVGEDLKKAGLPVISAHVPFLDLKNNLEKTVADYQFIGCKYIAIPNLPDEFHPGIGNFDAAIKEIRRIGEYCKKQGIPLLYHNHEFEFAKLPDGRYALDTLYEEVPASLLQTELDTCWVKVAGEDPAEYIEKYAGRCPVVHLKDFYKGKNCKQRVDEFRPIGLGMQVMPEILKAAQEGGAEYVVVEQDASTGRSAMEAVTISRRYLELLGY